MKNIFELDLRKVNESSFNEFRENIITYVNDLFNKEENNDYVIKDDKGLYIFNTVSKQEVIKQIKEKLINGCKGFINKKVDSGRELLVVELFEEAVNYEGENIKSINFNFVNSQENKTSSTGVNKLIAYFVNGDERILKYQNELNKTNLSQKAKDYLLDEFLESTTIFTKLDKIIRTETEYLADKIKDGINSKNLDVFCLSKNYISEYLKELNLTELADEINVDIKQEENNYNVSISLLNQKELIDITALPTLYSASTK